MTVGIAIGEMCANCARIVTKKASRVGRLVALATTLLLTVYLAVVLRSVAPAWRGTARTVGVVAVIVWYLLTYRIAKRVAREWIH